LGKLKFKKDVNILNKEIFSPEYFGLISKSGLEWFKPKFIRLFSSCCSLENWLAP
jgi:hypothetical protein